MSPIPGLQTVGLLGGGAQRSDVDCCQLRAEARQGDDTGGGIGTTAQRSMNRRIDIPVDAVDDKIGVTSGSGVHAAGECGGTRADTVTDEKGNAFYIVRVRTHKPSLGKSLPVIPGMQAQVDILTGKKTVLSYLLKPVLRAKANALTER